MIRELNNRSDSHAEVSLKWNDQTDEVSVTVINKDGTRASTIVAPHQAAEAFVHPYAYCASN